MTMIIDSAPADEVPIAQQVQQHWNSANQPAAIEALRPLADADRPWAVGLMCWLTMQQGMPNMPAGLPYARRAAAMGMPWAATNYFNNLLANIPSAPQFLDEAIALASTITPPFPAGIDPIGQGWNLLNQGRPNEAIRLMGMTYHFPISAEGWEATLRSASEKMTDLDKILSAATRSQRDVADEAARCLESMQSERDDLETKARQAGLLVSSVVSDATNKKFEEDATRNETEFRAAWSWGLGVLIAAAAVAILPLVLHYFDIGPRFNTSTLLGAHFASTLALATIAGVLLSRARVRDQARQHANDLSTAMSTMIAYSNQIANVDEKQRFMTTMGQLILQSHLTSGTSARPKEESLSGILALANLVRTQTTSTN